MVYGFTRQATGEPDKTDQVCLTVTGVREGGLRDLSAEFRSGPDRIAFPSAQGYRGNPIAIQFLERDIRDMASATGGSTAYLRNRIRKAFRDPQVQPVRVAVGGKELDALEIRVTPLKQDPYLADKEDYTDKDYLFVYSEQVPGDLVSIRTRMSGKNGEILEENLHYRDLIQTPEGDAN
jgi:hypothetical protein